MKSRCHIALFIWSCGTTHAHHADLCCSHSCYFYSHSSDENGLFPVLTHWPRFRKVLCLRQRLEERQIYTVRNSACGGASPSVLSAMSEQCRSKYCVPWGTGPAVWSVIPLLRSSGVLCPCAHGSSRERGAPVHWLPGGIGEKDLRERGRRVRKIRPWGFVKGSLTFRAQEEGMNNVEKRRRRAAETPHLQRIW